MQNLDRFRFRYYYYRDSKMIDCAEDCCDGGIYRLFQEFIEEHEENKGVLMQCTGLKDKNGKLIYEGDIVLSKNDNKSHIIGWDNGCFIFKKVNCKIGAEYEFRTDTEGCDYTIIGNIYENKEL